MTIMGYYYQDSRQLEDIILNKCRGLKMRLIKTYKGYESEYGIGRFYRSDIRKLNALRLYYDFPSNSRELFNNALDGKHVLLAVLKKGRRVIGYMMYEFPYIKDDDSLWLFRIPQRSSRYEFSGVSGVVSHYCEKILSAENPANLHLFVKEKE